MKCSKSLRLALILLSGAILVAVRAFENDWFYDPFIAHFKKENYVAFVPEFDTLKLFFYLLIRYALNSFVSMLILVLIFDIRIVRFLVVLYVIIGFILIPFYLILIYYFLPDAYTLLFYVRRFLIQPMLLFVLIPAVFYGRKTNKIHTFTTKK